MTIRVHRLPRKALRLSRRSAWLAAIVLVLAALTVFPLRQYFEQQAQVDTLRHELQLLTEQRRELEGELQRLEDPAYLEQLARECLGMVLPGEIAFVAVREDGEPAETPC
ncbi:MAG: FtsB family cell division protein [Actinomycetota bacterium]